MKTSDLGENSQTASSEGKHVVEESESTEGNTSDSGNSDSNSDMAPDAQKLEFCLEKDDWGIFTERLEIYFKAKDIPTAKEALTALTKFDEDAYKLLKNLCAPKKPVELTYAEIKKYMKDQLKPAPSEVMERCNFNQAKQEQNESIADFTAKLKKFSLSCNFKDLNTALRDQFV